MRSEEEWGSGDEGREGVCVCGGGGKGRREETIRERVVRCEKQGDRKGTQKVAHE